nr:MULTISPECIES: VIT1/CCC1 transporter family protein [unclassified Bradyrhizobium]
MSRSGEYVSVSSQSDTEHADLAREKRELADDPVFEREELTQIYVARGVEAGLAREVSKQLMANDALSAHARDELGISEISTARPVRAALASAATFSVGAVAPLALVLVSPSNVLIPAVAAGRLRWHWRPELVRLLARLRKRPFAEPLPQRGSALRSLLVCVRRNHVVLVVVARVKPWRRPQSRQPARETSISARRITHRAFEPGKLAVVDMVVSKKPCRIMMPFLPKRFSSR